MATACSHLVGLVVTGSREPAALCRWGYLKEILP